MKYRIITYFISMLFVSGCGVYNPHVIDIPLIHEKNDLRFDAGISILVPSVQTSFSYGITDKIAVEAFGSYGSDNRYYFQVSTGTFKKIKENFVQEIYGGFGYGYGSAYDDANSGIQKGNYQLYFFQYNIGKLGLPHSGLEFGLGIKSGYLHSNLLDNNYYLINPDPTFVEYKTNSLLFEPSVFVRLGRNRVRFNIIVGATAIYNFYPKENRIAYDLMNFGFGLNYRL